MGNGKNKAHVDDILVHTEDCLCWTGLQYAEHVLQFCPLFRETRRQQRPHGATLQEQLWDKMEDLKTTTFNQTTRLTI